MSGMLQYPNNLVPFGPDANCTLELCPAEWSIQGYQPSMPANCVFIALFAIALLIHVGEGIKFRVLGFTVMVAIGCLDEIIGYVGRLILYKNPFSNVGFLVEIGEH